jgi:hypothetical protein
LRGDRAVKIEIDLDATDEEMLRKAMAAVRHLLNTSATSPTHTVLAALCIVAGHPERARHVKRPTS